MRASSGENSVWDIQNWRNSRLPPSLGKLHILPASWKIYVTLPPIFTLCLLRDQLFCCTSH